MRRECTRAVVIQGDSFAAAEAAADGFARHRKISNRVVKLTAFSAVSVIDARNMLVLCRISLTRLSSRHLLNAVSLCRRLHHASCASDSFRSLCRLRRAEFEAPDQVAQAELE
jgi:hypothetical protein